MGQTIVKNLLGAYMPYAVDYDENGNEIYVPGISLPGSPEPGQIDVEDLLAGDVLVWYLPTQVADKNHDLIRDSTKGAYSHASIYLGDRLTVDADTKKGIVLGSIDDLLQGFEVGNVLRWEGEHDVSVAVRHARSMVGYKYALIDALLLPARRRGVKARRLQKNGIADRLARAIVYVRRFVRPRKAAYCSQMVVESYAACGVFSDYDVAEACLSPNDLITLGNFAYKGYLWKKKRHHQKAPDFHPLDLNAPIFRSERKDWVSEKKRT